MVPVFVLTLADAQHRQNQVLAWAGKAGLVDRGLFVEGVDLRAAAADFTGPATATAARMRRYGSEQLTPPEYGCLLGHRRIWERIAASQLDGALVLEDDAAPTADGWLEAVDGLAQQLRLSSLAERRWVVHLALEEHSRRTLALRPVRWRRASLPACPELGEVDGRVGSLWTTTAYLISRRAAQQLLDRESDLPWVADDWEQRQRQGTVAPLLAARNPLFQPASACVGQISRRSGCLPVPCNRLRRKGLTLAYRAGWLQARY
jgi:GR25 family glycosyltransferase involved in LPS biosynthesis